MCEIYNTPIVSSDKSDRHFLTSDQYSKIISVLNDKRFLEIVSSNANMASMMCNNFFY